MVSTSPHFNNNLGGEPVIEYGTVTEYDHDPVNNEDKGKTVSYYEHVPLSRTLSSVLGVETFKHAQFSWNYFYTNTLVAGEAWSIWSQNLLQSALNGPDEFSFYESTTWKRGKLSKEEIYKTENSIDVLRAKVENTYETIETSKISSNYVFTPFPSPFHTWSVAENPYNQGSDLNSIQFGYQIGEIEIGRRVLKQTINTVYDDAGQNPVINTTDYHYDNLDHKQVTRIETVNSKDEKITTTTRYPDDVLDIGSLGLPDLDPVEKGIIDRLKKDDLHRIAEPVQIETTVKNSSGTVLASSTRRTDYTDLGSNLVLPEFIKSLKGTYSATTNPLEERLHFDNYDDHGNVQEVSRANGPTVSYLWGYDKMYPIAKIENATYAQISAALAITETVLKGYDENNLSAINGLRTSLPGAMVNTYTYDPLIGVISMTDPSGYTVNYEYDPLNRISAIDDTSDQRYSLTNIEYDKNGNIQKLKRNGHTNNGATSFGVMDDLTYSYTGNQLKAVDDDIASSATQGFIDGTELATEYTYDTNGNLQSDSNKGITSISYNHFDLPTEVVFDNNPNKKVSYVYAANMTRIKKLVVDGATNKTIDYSGKFIYENGALQFMSHAGGYAVTNGSNWDYIYQFKDNLGNIRLSYSDINNDGSVDSSEILHERNNYPFGLLHKGYNGNIQGIVNNYMEFQGQELDKSLNLNWHHFKYRTYDMALGRFLQIDPLATTYEYNSTYAFAENNVTSGIDLEGKELSFELDGNRATAVFGPTTNTLTLQEAASQVSQQKTERDALMSKIAPKYDGAQAGAGNIGYSSTHISRVGRIYPQSGYTLAETVGVAAKEAATDFFGGALIVGGIRAIRGGKSVWNLGRFARGRSIENTLGANQQWAKNFPVIDKIQDGAATSIKSLDLTAKSYNKGNGLLNTLKGYVNKLDNFGGRTRWGGVTVEEGVDYSSKTLELAVETGQGTSEQWSQINKAIEYALDKDINFTIRFID